MAYPTTGQQISFKPVNGYEYPGFNEIRPGVCLNFNLVPKQICGRCDT
jgi:hypothetical protein